MTFDEHKRHHWLSFLTAVPMREGGWLEIYTVTNPSKLYQRGQIVRFHFWFADGLKYEELKV